MRVVTQYICDVCGAVYDSAEEALAGEAIPEARDESVSIGDIVALNKAYGWWEGSPDWFEEAADMKPPYRGFPLFVVVGFAPYSHFASARARCSPWFHQRVSLLYSPSGSNGEPVFAWTAPHTHLSVRPVGRRVDDAELERMTALTAGKRPVLA